MCGESLPASGSRQNIRLVFGVETMADLEKMEASRGSTAVGQRACVSSWSVARRIEPLLERNFGTLSLPEGWALKVTQT